MKLFLVTITFFILANAQAIELDYLRENYEKAVTDRDLCEKLIDTLSNGNQNAIHQAYLGAFQTIWANHVFNPLSKLKTFREGKKNLEQAIETEPNNVEMRFLRLSIQKNCPEILGYNDAVISDKAFLETNKKNIESSKLKTMIDSLLNSFKS